MIEPLEKESKPIKEKGGNLIRNILIFSIILLILGLVIFSWISVKHPEWIKSEKTDTEPIQKDTTQKSNTSKILIFTLGGGIVILIGYIIIKGISEGGTHIATKIPVKPTRAFILFRENFSKETQIECTYDATKEVEAYVPANPEAVILNDRVPFYHTATGDNFMLFEIEVREGNQQGIHTVIVPIDRGEELISGGYYRIDTHTPRFQHQLQRINFPLSSMQDKQDRMKIALMESGEQEKADSIKQTAQNYISTPMDELGQGTQTQYIPQPRRTTRRYQPARRRW